MLLSSFTTVNNCFCENFMILDPGKCHFMSIGKNTHDEDGALLSLPPYLDTNKRKTIYTTMVKSQLNYCPLVWMFCPRRSSKLINKVQERAPLIIYNDQLTDFKYLLSNHNEATIHQRNLQVLITEIYKIINHIAPAIMSPLFEIRENTS